jgi:hypothetical protein
MNKKTIFLFAILIGFNLLVYFPSFFDSARGTDHHIFLSDIAKADTLPQLIKESYSYNRLEGAFKGDKILFVPFIFLLLAFEKWLFGYDFFWWQITGFCLHLIAQWCLWRVLRSFVSLRWSFLAVLLSSVLFLQQETVVRHHLNGYLLFQIFALTAIYQFFKYCQDPQTRNKSFISSLSWLTLASFTYEGALLINGLFIALVYTPWKTAFAKFPKRDKVLIFFPAMIYLAVSALDFFARVKNFSFVENGLTGSVQPGSFDVGMFLNNMGQVVNIGLQGFLLPAFTKIKFVGDQYHYATFTWSAHTAAEIANTVLFLFAASFLIFSVGVAIKNTSAIKTHFKANVFVFGLTMLIFVFFYIGLICLLRLQTNPGYLHTVPHHFYLIYSFTLAGILYLANPFLSFIDQHRPRIAQTLFVALISLALLQGYFLQRLNNDLRVRWEPQRIFLREIDRFVKDHKKEPDFSFAIAESELYYKHVVYLKENQAVLKSLVEMLFPQYIGYNNPKYAVVYTKKEGLLAFRTIEEALRNFQEMTAKNGTFQKELYLGGTKVDLRMFTVMFNFPQLYQQKKNQKESHSQ